MFTCVALVFQVPSLFSKHTLHTITCGQIPHGMYCSNQPSVSWGAYLLKTPAAANCTAGAELRLSLAQWMSTCARGSFAATYLNFPHFSLCYCRSKRTRQTPGEAPKRPSPSPRCGFRVVRPPARRRPSSEPPGRSPARCARVEEYLEMVSV